MTLTIRDKQYLRLEAVEELAKIVKESVRPLENSLGEIARRLGHEGPYLSFVENPYHDTLLSVSTSQGDALVPRIYFGVSKANLVEDSFSHGRIDASLNWGEFRGEWVQFYEEFAGAYKPMIDFVTKNHTGEKWTVTGVWSNWDKEEDAAIWQSKVREFPQIGVSSF